MSLYGAEFIRESKERLGDCELNFTPHGKCFYLHCLESNSLIKKTDYFINISGLGYLVLASEEGAEVLTRNSRLQNELGARNELLSATQLKSKFPWMNTDGVVLGMLLKVK